MSKTGMTDDREIDWGEGFKNGVERWGAWESFIESQHKLPEEQQLSPTEQIELGVRVCLNKYDPNQDLSALIRNSKDPTRYILEQPFKRAFQSTSKELYELMISTPDITTKKDEIIKKILEGFPPEVLQGLAHFYKKHIDEGNKIKDKESRKDEFVRIIMFQFVLPAIQDHANGDEEFAKITKAFSTLYKPGTGKPGAAFDGFKKILDELLTHLQPLDEKMSENLSKKVERSREAAYSRIPKNKEKQKTIHQKLEKMFYEIREDNRKKFGEGEKLLDFEENNKDIIRLRSLISKVALCYNPEKLVKYAREAATIYLKLKPDGLLLLNLPSSSSSKEAQESQTDSTLQETQAESTSQESQAISTPTVPQSAPSPKETSAVSTPSPSRESIELPELPPLPDDEPEEDIPLLEPVTKPPGRLAKAWTALTGEIDNALSAIGSSKAFSIIGKAFNKALSAAREAFSIIGEAFNKAFSTIGKTLSKIFSRKDDQAVQPVTQTPPSAEPTSPTVPASTSPSSQAPAQQVSPTAPQSQRRMSIELPELPPDESEEISMTSPPVFTKKYQQERQDKASSPTDKQSPTPDLEKQDKRSVRPGDHR